MNEMAPYETHILALKAAYQIDLARRGKTYDSRAINALISSLETAANADQGEEAVKALMPTDLNVLTRAISAYNGSSPSSLHEVWQMLLHLLQELKSPLHEREKGELSQLIAFCVTLNNEILANRSSFYEQRQPSDLIRA